MKLRKRKKRGPAPDVFKSSIPIAQEGGDLKLTVRLTANYRILLIYEEEALPWNLGVRLQLELPHATAYQLGEVLSNAGVHAQEHEGERD